jgi:hypothetical protein
MVSRVTSGRLGADFSRDIAAGTVQQVPLTIAQTRWSDGTPAPAMR